MPQVIPVILSGGSGTRLWPLSRSMYPKQFIRFFDDQSCFRSTLRRVQDDPFFLPPIVLCNSDHRFLVREEFERAGMAPKAIILEPVARNTAAAIAVAALAAVRDDPSAVILVMPSDHVIADEVGFRTAVKSAAGVAAKGMLVLLGIKPAGPHTGYGYISGGEPIAGADRAVRVAAFCEKPNLATAKSYLKKEYVWNSGIFVLNARTFLNELAHYAPGVLKAATAALDNAVPDLEFLRLDGPAFATSPSISVDHAVMEKTKSAAMLRIDVGWNDIGSWTSLWDIAPKDAAGNSVMGDGVLQDTEGCYIHSERALIATVGVKDLVIVETPDAVLVADKQRAQEVAGLVAQLRTSGRNEPDQHVRNFRPWGYFETLNVGTRFQVKLLHVKPGGKLSLQMHHHRSEHWIVVQGTARVVIGDQEKLVRENESVYIIATQWHRLENPGKVPLELIEVQIGTYLGEDDIIRSDDVYHRAPEETR